MRSQALTPLFEKKRELETKIVTLKSQCETDERKTGEAAEALTDLNTRLNSLNKTIEEVEKLGDEAVSAVSKVIEGAEEATSAATRAVEGAYVLLGGLESRIAEKEVQLTKTTEEHRARIEEINAENGKLAVLKKDLDIYHDRLQKKYYELGLGELILPK